MIQQRKTLVSMVAAVLFWAMKAGGATVTLVNDTWQDGDRTMPAAPTYSEAGIDSDADGDLESAWFNGGAGAVMTASPGNLRMDPADAPATWTTYMTSEAGVVGLNINDFFLFTWRFRTGDVNAADTGQNFRIAMVDSAPAARLTADGSPPSGVYFGLALFGNMAETTGNANSFELRERNGLPTSPLLEDTAAWSPIANGLGPGVVGYADNTQYTFTMMIKRIPGALDIAMTMAGGNIGGTGTVSVNVVDTTPISAAYDTFSIYVGDQASSATLFDTSLFMVERGHDEPVMPEPASGVLAVIASLAVFTTRRARQAR